MHGQRIHYGRITYGSGSDAKRRTGPCPWSKPWEDALEKLESWRDRYGGERPHGAPRNLTPREFAMPPETGD